MFKVLRAIKKCSLLFSMALELFYLVSEIESFYEIDPHLTGPLERWIVEQAESSTETSQDPSKGSRIEVALDILDWAPVDSEVRSKRLQALLLFLA